MKLKGILLLLAATLSIGALAKPPPNVISEYLATGQGGFTLHPNMDVSYFLALDVSEKLPLPAWLQIEFQHQVDAGDMDLKYLKIEPGTKTLRLESRAFPRANLRKTFRVVIDVFADEKMRTKIGEHVQEIEFRR